MESLPSNKLGLFKMTRDELEKKKKKKKPYKELEERPLTRNPGRDSTPYNIIVKSACLLSAPETDHFFFSRK